MAIRIAIPDDASPLGSMHVAFWRETYAGILPDKMLAALSVEGRAAAWAKIMQEPANERSTVVKQPLLLMLRAEAYFMVHTGHTWQRIIIQDPLKARALQAEC